MALLVLPGAGLLLVLAGLILLANAFPAVQRFVAPVRTRAMQAMRESVTSPFAPRLLGGHRAGAHRRGRGVGAVAEPALGGWPTGMSLILSGLILLGLLVVSYRHVAQRRRTPAP